MAFDVQNAIQLLHKKQALAVADRILIDPESGTLVSRVEELLTVMKEGAPADQACRMLIRLWLNLAGCDAEIVGYSMNETAKALESVLAVKAFDEAPDLKDELKREIEKHDEWKKNPHAYADDMAMDAIAL